MGRRIYLDHAAGSPLRDEALAAMLPHLQGPGANASGLHRFGREAQLGLDAARATIAGVLNCAANEVVFTSGGTESVNAAVKGTAIAELQAGAGNHVITTQAEHQAALNSCRFVERFGCDVTYLPVDEHGLVAPDDVAAAIRPGTVVISLTYANNEVGSVQPIADTIRLIRERERALGVRISVHIDAVQAPGLLPVDLQALGADLASFSSHKFGGPAGAGALYIRRATPFLPHMDGGMQERRRRAGSENVAGAVGMAVAMELADGERAAVAPRLAEQRDRLTDGIAGALPWAKRNGHPSQRLPNVANFSFAGVDGEALIVALDERGIAASAGSACANVTWEPSHVLLAMGRSLGEASGGLRLSLGRTTTDDEIATAIAIVPEVVERLAAARARRED